MESARDVASEFRANVRDFLSYLIPGGALLVGLIVIFSPGIPPSVQSAAQEVGSFSAGLLLTLALLVISYSAGAVLHALDSAADQHILARLRLASSTKALLCRMGADPEDSALATALEQCLTRNSLLPPGGGQRVPPMHLHNTAEMLVALRAPGSLQGLLERYEVVADLSGHLAWVALVLMVSFLLATAGRGGSDVWRWVTAAVAIISFLVLQRRKRNIRDTRVKWVWTSALLLCKSGTQGTEQTS